MLSNLLNFNFDFFQIMDHLPKKSVKFDPSVLEKNYLSTVVPRILKTIRKGFDIKVPIKKHQKYEEIRKRIENAFPENLAVRNKLLAKSYCAEAIFLKNGKTREELLNNANLYDETKDKCHFFQL